jgi:hypothetical protein
MKQANAPNNKTSNQNRRLRASEVPYELIPNQHTENALDEAEAVGVVPTQVCEDDPHDPQRFRPRCRARQLSISRDFLRD